jgi:hypothetical protein
MRFLRQYRYVLIFLALLVFCSVMVLWEYSVSESAHVERREDFILLQTRGRVKETERLYQRLIQEMPALSDRILANDLQRTSMLINPQAPDTDNLVRKYNISVKNELTRRAERRVNRAQQAAEKE